MSRNLRRLLKTQSSGETARPSKLAVNVLNENIASHKGTCWFETLLNMNAIRAKPIFGLCGQEEASCGTLPRKYFARIWVALLCS